MSKVTEFKSLVIAYGDARVNASSGSRETWSADSARMDKAFEAVIAALEAASSTPDGEADSLRTWLELREPGCVPERKGPMPPTMVAGFLRELFEHRPQAYVTVITIGHDGPLLQDGPECLQMLDGRSMNVGRRAIENQRAAHGAHPAPIKDDVVQWKDVLEFVQQRAEALRAQTPRQVFWALLDDMSDKLRGVRAIDENPLSHNAGEIEAGGEAKLRAAICEALLNAYPMADKIADNYAAVAARAALKESRL